MSEPPPLTDLEHDIVAKVDKYGCMIMHVFDDGGEGPDFSYSIGFPERAGQPDVIVFGLRKELMHSMINELFRQMQEDGLELSDGSSISDLLVGFDCIAREITDANAIREHFGSAIWYNRRVNDREMDRGYQIVWPGAYQRLFPWDEGCDSDVIELQPPLYERTN